VVLEASDDQEHQDDDARQEQAILDYILCSQRAMRWPAQNDAPGVALVVHTPG
jgi:hypothetical protein